MGPHPAVAAIRLAVRRVLHDILTELNTTAAVSAGTATERVPGHPPSPLVLVACSGGADSMALASALAFEAPGSASAPAASPSTTACRTAPTCAPKKSSCACANSASTPSRRPP